MFSLDFKQEILKIQDFDGKRFKFKFQQMLTKIKTYKEFIFQTYNIQS